MSEPRPKGGQGNGKVPAEATKRKRKVKDENRADGGRWSEHDRGDEHDRMPGAFLRRRTLAFQIACHKDGGPIRKMAARGPIGSPLKKERGGG